MYRKAVFLFFSYEKLLSSGLNNDAPNPHTLLCCRSQPPDVGRNLSTFLLLVC